MDMYHMCLCLSFRSGEPQNGASHLYNAMIHPYFRMPIYGAIWYQGKTNFGWNIILQQRMQLLNHFQIINSTMLEYNFEQIQRFKRLRRLSSLSYASRFFLYHLHWWIWVTLFHTLSNRLYVLFTIFNKKKLAAHNLDFFIEIYSNNTHFDKKFWCAYLLRRSQC